MGKIIQYTSGISNGFFIVDKGVIAVDCGSELSDEVFVNICKKCGIEPESINLIITTHGHGDHFVNMENMRSISGAPIMCHSLAAPRIVGGIYPKIKPRNAMGREMFASGHATEFPWVQPKFTPDIMTTGTVELEEWGVAGRLVETPGHMPGSYSVILDWGEAIAGDLVVLNPMTGKCDLGYFAEDPLDGESLFKSVEIILQTAQTIYSGHGGPFTAAEVKAALEKGKEEFYADRAAGLL